MKKMKGMKAKYLAVLGFALTLGSCTAFDDYLDITPSGEKVLTQVREYADIINNENYTSYTINDVNSLSDNQWTNPQAYFQSTSITTGKINFMYLADPVVYNRYTYLNPSSKGDYTKYYEAISRYNMILYYIDDAEGDANLRTLTKAEAKLLRALRHFYLVNIYAPTYNPATAATDLAIPIRDEFDLEKEMTQSTVAEVYAAIEKDIDEALPDLSNTPENVYHPSRAAAYALKAKVCLQKGDFAGAKEAAQESYALHSQLFDLIDYVDNGNGRVIKASQAENLLFGFTTNTERPYISPQVKALYEKDSDDCRYAPCFFKPDKAQDNNRDDNNYISRWQLQGTQFAKNTMGLSTPDVMLILAECNAREGNLTEAMRYVNELRAKRIRNYSSKQKPNPQSEAEVMQIVMDERRREFPFGIIRLLDLRRLGNDPKYAITATRLYPANPNSIWSEQKEYSLQPGSYLLTAPIPIPVLNEDTYMHPTTEEVWEQ